jgi:Flp pilus assembly pilin Flp
VSNIITSVYAWAVSLRSSVVESLKPESGQDLIEYAVLAGAIGIALAAAFLLLPLGNSMNAFAGKISDCITFSSTCK